MHSIDGIPMEPPSNPAFEHWCYTTTDDSALIDGRPVPLLTTLIYRVCNGDQDKFRDVLKALQAAFEAGQRSTT
jgi:hypothetical protein